MTGNLLVGSLKNKIGIQVIESLLVEQQDIGLAPFMVGMTIPALLFSNSGISTVKAALGSDIRSHQLMAVEAEVALLPVSQQTVTFITITLDSGVPFDQGTRHHQLGDVCQAKAWKKMQQHHNKQQYV